MLTRITLTVESDNRPIYAGWGYALYGMIASLADTEYMNYLHSADGFALHQYITGGGKSAQWVINLLGTEAYEQLGEIFTRDKFAIDYYESNLRVTERQITTISEYDFCKQYLIQQEAQRRMKIKFVSPCSFKSQKRYQIFPKEDWIINSLWKHWQSYAKEIILDDAQAQQQIIDYTKIVGYSMHSTEYRLKGQKIPSFIGNLDIKIDGPDPLVRLVNLLLSFGTYSGVGIKNALGMGGYILV